MAAIDFETLALLESAADPSSKVFGTILEDLYDVAESKKYVNGADEIDDQPWVRKFPFSGSAVENRDLLDRFPDMQISDKATYTQGVGSLMSLFYRINSMYANYRKVTLGRVLIVSSYARELCDMFYASDPHIHHIDFTSGTNYAAAFNQNKYTIVVVDHTTVTVGINQLFSVCVDMGVSMIEGLFYYSPAIDNGWSGVYGDDKIMINHTLNGINIGPVDDPTRILFYPRQVYAQFTDPSKWGAKAKKWFYEVKSHGILSTYQASYVGSVVSEEVTFRVPVCSSPDMVLLVIDREFATGMFASSDSHNRAAYDTAAAGMSSNRAVTTSYGAATQNFDLFSTRRDYGIEVRKKLYDDAVLYLIGRPKGTDLVTEAIKYIAAHNYSDLFEGTRIISAKSLSYTDALCTAVICAVQAYVLRYGLTNESIRSIVIARDQSFAISKHGLSGFLSRLSYFLKRYTTQVLYELPNDYLVTYKSKLVSTDLVPGVFYDIYRDRTYSVGAKWYETGVRTYNLPDVSNIPADDPITAFVGDNLNASAPDFLIDQEATAHLSVGDFSRDPHVFQPVDNPVDKLQDVYDTTFPGNSVADLANVAELRKTRDIDISLEFVGRINVGMDSARPEILHDPMPLRTSALPTGRSGLLDSVLATAKRNFSVPDMQDVTSVAEFSRRLVDEFISNACVPGARQVTESYRAQPIILNVNTYSDWLAGKSESYYAALLGDIPDELVHLGLERYTSILKGRIKPKLSVASQKQLGQPQVVNHQRKVETGIYSGILRQAFERFDSLLSDNYKSAGRVSDAEISDWLSSKKTMIATSKLLEADSSMYDKSQSILALTIEVEMLTRLGVSFEVTEALKKSFVGIVNARNAGLTFVIAMQRKSGHVDTMIGNLIYNFVSLGHSIGYSKINGMIAKGDDNIAFLDSILFSDDNAADTAEKMGKYFNLESKMILHEVPGFSSGGIVFHGDRVRFFPDPLKLIELLGEKTSDDGTFVHERFQSFRDRVSCYNYAGLPELIQQWVRSRYKVSSDIVGAIEALLTISHDFSLFKSLR